jgi:uncharacterized protein
MPYNILSLDGGGTWALVQARVLEAKYGPEKKGHDILADYDLVIANSGGSLVLGMLCANKTVQEIVNTFNNVEVLRSIFKRKIWHYIPILKRFVPNYYTENKYEVFVNHFKNKNSLGHDVSYGEMLLPDLQKEIEKEIKKRCPDIIITVFDYDRQRAVYFRSNRDSKMESAYIENQVRPGSATDPFKAVTLAQAVHAASNAPVQFFDDPAAFPLTMISKDGRKQTVRNRLYWDGAVGGNNNPVKVGVLEALGNAENRDERRKEIKVVSIGTSSTVVPVLYGDPGECQPEFDWMARRSKIDNMLDDIERISNSILNDPPDAASFDAHQVLGLAFIQNDERFVRINPMIKPKLEQRNNCSKDGWYMPGKAGSWTAQEMHDLFTMDMAIATEYGVTLINRLCDDFIAGDFDNQGIRIGGRKMAAILGHRTFAEALAHWENKK